MESSTRVPLNNSAMDDVGSDEVQTGCFRSGIAGRSRYPEVVVPVKRSCLNHLRDVKISSSETAKCTASSSSSNPVALVEWKSLVAAGMCEK